MLIDTQAILTQARAEGYAIGAFNIYNLEGAAAVVRAAESVKSPVMLQLLPSALSLGGRALVRLCLTMAEYAKIPVAIHLDHCPSTEMIKLALDCGIQSIMADGSDLSYTDNIKFTCKIRELVKAQYPEGAVEAELGKISGTEDDITVDASEASLTNPGQALDFVEATGVTALAVCIGNIHGKYSRPPQLDFARLESIAKNVAIPLVLHGTSGLPDTLIKRAIELGVCKFNVNTEVRSAYLSTMQSLLCGSERVDLTQLMHTSIDVMQEVVCQKIELFCSSNRA